MKTISLEVESELAQQLLESARDEDVLVRLSDGSEFLIVLADDFEWEIARTRANSSFMKVLRERSQETSRSPLADVRRELLGD